MTRSRLVRAAALAAAVLPAGGALAGTDQAPITPDVMNASDVPDATLAGSPLKLARIVGPAQDFANHCQGCHGAAGVSVDEMPQLKDRVGYFTRSAAGRAYLIEVPNVAQSRLSDERLAAMMNWLLRTYGREALPADFADYTAAEVGAARTRRIEPASAREGIVQDLVRDGLIPSGLSMGLKPYRNY